MLNKNYLKLKDPFRSPFYLCN